MTRKIQDTLNELFLWFVALGCADFLGMIQH